MEILEVLGMDPRLPDSTPGWNLLLSQAGESGLHLISFPLKDFLKPEQLQSEDFGDIILSTAQVKNNKLETIMF